jgi:hypothetical protein
MIRSFRNRDLKKAWELGKSFAHKKLPAKETYWILDALNAATDPREVAFFGQFYEWNEAGAPRFGVMVTEHWLISYGWSGGHAVDVDLEWQN